MDDVRRRLRAFFLGSFSGGGGVSGVVVYEMRLCLKMDRLVVLTLKQPYINWFV